MIYSQNDEQVVIEKYFGDHIGVFADFGANDGITLSNTYALALKGWKGLLVEPSEVTFEKLQRNYSGLTGMVMLQFAVTGTYEGVVTFHESGTHLNKGDLSLLSTVHKSERNKWKSSKEVFIETLVHAMPVNKILELASEAGNFETIDLFSIDIEGSEKEVLPLINFAKWKTRMVVVENNHRDQQWFDGVMLQQGFKFMRQTPENLIYAK